MDGMGLAGNPIPQQRVYPVLQRGGYASLRQTGISVMKTGGAIWADV